MLTHYQSKIALGSKIDLTLVSNTGQSQVNEFFRQLWLEIFKFEKLCSRFLPASELSLFNKAAGIRQAVSPEFKTVLIAVKKMSVLSNGLYNPFILPALQRAGYVYSMVAAHSHDEVDDFSDRSVVSPKKLEIGNTWASIPHGTAIDIGGCGKGYACDLLAGLADTFPGLTGYWFSLGGDVITGGLDEGGKPWIIYIEATNLKEGAMAGKVELLEAEHFAVATSSVTRRQGKKGGKVWHHIIDPRTGKPSISDTITASVCARSAIEADVLASCAIILGVKQSQAFLANKNIEGAVIQTKDRRIIRWGALVQASDS
jgi:thiamine biosynthesis lipoprotein